MAHILDVIGDEVRKIHGIDGNRVFISEAPTDLSDPPYTVIVMENDDSDHRGYLLQTFVTVWLAYANRLEAVNARQLVYRCFRGCDTGINIAAGHRASQDYGLVKVTPVGAGENIPGGMESLDLESVQLRVTAVLA